MRYFECLILSAMEMNDSTDKRDIANIEQCLTYSPEQNYLGGEGTVRGRSDILDAQ